MPIYEYECKSCENVFEVQQRMTDEPLKKCPDCRGEVKKLVSVSSFQLKGGGWYSDGYSGLSNGKGKNGGSAAKKEPAATPPCQKSGAEGCKSCPAATA
ncbi:MAG: zinc ribbon domain-containing protein [Desulfobulbaceae bacterium]|nr:zinc ribbon domain-containing protein [Desulfobulbaceae bacterium]